MTASVTHHRKLANLAIFVAHALSLDIAGPLAAEVSLVVEGTMGIQVMGPIQETTCPISRLKTAFHTVPIKRSFHFSEIIFSIS